MTDSIIVKFSPAAVEEKRLLLEEAYGFVTPIVIRNKEELDEANLFLKDVKAEAKAIKEMKDAVLAPINQGLANFRAFFAPLEALCDKAEKALKEKIADYVVAKRREEEENSAKLLAAVDQSDYNTLSALVETSTTAPVLQGTSVREVWVATIAYPNTVPRTWCIPDEKRIAEHARRTPAYATPEPIAGVTFNKKSIVTSR